MADACNVSTWEAEAGWLGVQGQLGLHSEALSEKERDRAREGRKEGGRKERKFEKTGEI
jgi:hypothetical protein